MMDVMLEKVEKVESNPSNFLELAIKQGLSIEHLERLMGLQERWQANQSRMAFLNAMAAFQSGCPILEKTKKVAFGNTKYSYAPLGEIAQTLKTVLFNNGLSFRWEMQDKEDSIVCTCIISHIAGHSEQSTMSAKKDTSGNKNEIQSRGSTITYLQRYTLIAALGISTADEDIDGRNDKQTDVPKEPQQKKPDIPEQRNFTEEASRCGTLIELKAWWESLSAQEKKICEAVKKNRKEEIETELKNIDPTDPLGLNRKAS